jgi:sulfofructose kinase
MNQSECSVLTLGSAVLDFLFQINILPRTAEKYRADDASIILGGCAANAATAITRLGGDARLLTRLGDDPVGDLIQLALERENIDTSLVNRRAAGRSPFSSIFVDGLGERQIVNFRGSGLVAETDWIRRAPRSDAVLVDTRWPAGALVALELAREWGVCGVVDGEAPVDPRLLNAASHIAFSRQGLEHLAKDTNLPRALASVTALTDAFLCVTDGDNGVYWFGNGAVLHCPAFEVDVIDTLGAGDVWHGAFALRLASGDDEATAIRYATAAAAIKCRTFGGLTGAPDHAAVAGFLKERGE